MDTKTCLNCGVSFSKGNTRPCRWGDRKYCSVRCLREKTCIKKGTKPWNTGIKMTEEQKKAMNLSGLEKGRGLFKGKKLPQFSGENHPNWKPKTHKNCETCQKEMLLPPNEQDKRFCSHECYTKWNRGINNPRFLGDKALGNLRMRIMELPEYKEWRKLVLLRDYFTCTICGITGNQLSKRKGKNNFLSVDHVKRMCSIIRENNLKTPEDARNCQELFDTNNGRVLCWNCHRKTQTYGTTGLKNHKTHY